MLTAGIFGSARVSSGAATYETEVLADSPLFYFPLGESAAPPVDQMSFITPSSYSGITFGATGVGDRATAVSMNSAVGANGLYLPGSTIGTPTALTIEILAAMIDWVSADEIMRWEGVLSLRHASTNDGIQGYFGGTTSGFTVGASYSPADLNGVHHWTMTWDGTTTRIYDNGTEVRSAARTVGTPGTSLVIGGNPIATNRNINGRFGGVAYYTTALSAARILAHAQAAGVA